MTTDYIKQISIASILIGIILLLSIAFFENTWVSQGSSKIIGLIIGLLAIFVPFIGMSITSRKNKNKANKTFSTFESHKLIKINNLVLLLIVIVSSTILSTFLVNNQEQFVVFFSKLLIIIAILMLIQYYKGIYFIIKSKK